MWQILQRFIATEANFTYDYEIFPKYLQWKSTEQNDMEMGLLVFTDHTSSILEFGDILVK